MTPYYSDQWLDVYQGDCFSVLQELPAESVHTVVTSPPYFGLRDYGMPGQIGLEETPEEYVHHLVLVFQEVRRVLRSDGTVWLNLGDSYASHDPGGYRPGGLKPKDLVGIPWRVAFALQTDGWYLRSDIIWAKPNPMPESVTDRPTKAHEYLFLLSKSPRYYYDADAVREPHAELDRPQSEKRRLQRLGREVAPVNGGGQSSKGIDDGWVTPTHTMRTNEAGRNLRSVWTIATQPYPGAHFATFPRKLVEPCVKAGTSERGVCPECGAPWVRVVERFGVPRDVFPSSTSRRPGDDVNDARTANSGMSNGTPRVETVGWKPPYVAPSEIDRYGTGEAGVHRKVGGQYQKWLDAHPKSTTGWSGPCRHEGDPIPATVLDPFAGSGTTGVVAQSLNRRAILIDLNGDYLVQAMGRNSAIPLGLGA